jgi:hypothetical protein
MSNKLMHVDKLMWADESAINDLELWEKKNAQLQYSNIYTIEALSVIKERELYRHGGYESFSDYVERGTAYSRSQAYVFLAIGRELLPLIKSTSKDNWSDIVALMSDIGNAKLRLLASAKGEYPDIVESLFVDGRTTLPDGKEIVLDELRGMLVGDLQKSLRRHLAVADEEKNKFKAEAKRYQRESESKDAAIENTRIIEQTYGRLASKLEEKQHILQRCRDALSLIDQLMVQIAIDEEDHLYIRSDLRDFLDRMVESRRRAYLRHSDVLAFFDDELIAIKDPKPMLEEKVKGVIYQNLADMTIMCKPADVVGDQGWEPLESGFETHKEMGIRAAELRLDGYVEWSTKKAPEKSKGAIRMDETRMAIKMQSHGGPYSHGWKNLENGFETKEDMERRFAELLSDGYVNG